jgi:transposase InsO family protein
MTGDEVGNVVTGETMGEIEDLTRGPRYFKNIDEVLPNFDPVKEDISVNQWIDKIEEYAEIYDWDDLAIRHFGLSKLCGVARAWRDSLPRQERKWQDWCRLLRENFPCQENRMAITLDAQNYKRKSGQHIVEYFYEKLARCNKAAMSEQETIEWIVHGLNNNKFRDHLGPLSRYKRPSELLPDIKSASNYISDTKDKVFGKHFVSGNEKTNPRGTPKCYQCGKEGHIARNCFSNKSKSVTCFKCSKIGHYAKDCGRFRETQSKSAVSSSSTEGIKVLQIGSDTHRKYFKDALINGRPTKCYIDLGSSCVTIRLDLVEQMGYTYFETDLEPLVGYGQGVVKPIGMLTVDLTIDDVTAKVNAHVVPNDSQLVPVLVGHPYTEQPHVCIISTSDELMVRNGLSDFFNVNEANDKKTHISSSKQVTIPSNYLGHVSICSTVVNETLCIEGGMRENGHVIPRCVIEVDNEGKSALPVLNLSNKPLVFKEGDRITRGEICKIAEVDGKREINDEPISYEDIHTDLLEEDASVLLDMLNENKGLIAKNLRQIGLTNKIEMKIDLKDETPVYYRPYRMAITEKQQVKKIVEELKDADIIEDSNSPFASPVLLVKKKTGDLRMCIDYRALNKQTVKDHYPIPLIDDQLDRMCKMKYFTSLDLSSGYYQVPMNKDSREKTAFITADGHYQFKRMPFGLCNAPSVFQRLINLVLGNLRYDVAMAYIDDIIIPSECVEDGVEKLRLVLEALKNAGLTLNLNKCNFFMNKVEYLGFEISELGISPGSRKLHSIEKFPIPKDTRAVRSFVGLASFFRRFVRGFSKIISPLTELLRKDVKFKWENAQQIAFEEIKLRLGSKPVLAVYNPNARTEVHTDACAIGLGGVLLQEQSDGKLHPVSYFSRKTTKDESKYHSFELEALAIVCALERFRVYLLGIKFVIRTDCNSLKLLANKRDLSARIGRWFVRLSEFNYTIEYHKGVSNVVADGLSRNPVGEAEEVSLVGLPVMGITINTDWIAAMQRNDDEVLAVRRKLEDSDEEMSKKFTLHKGRVYKVTKGVWRLYVPVDLRSELVIETHKSLMHLGIDKTLGQLKKSYYFPKMREVVTKHVNRCINCLYYKLPSGKIPGFLHPLDKGSAPFQCVHIDHSGPYVTTKNKNKYVVGLVDGYSKFIVLKAVRDTGSVGAMKFLKEFISVFGKPLKITSDRGTAFTSDCFKTFCDLFGIQHVKIASSTPRANGQMERMNKIITSCLATSVESEESNDWDEKLFQVQWAINSSVHSVTKRSPNEIVFSYKGFGLEENPLTQEIIQLNSEIQLNDEAEEEEIQSLLRKNQEKMKTQFDKKRREPPTYSEKDLVMVRCEAPSTGQSRKLTAKYRGPYEVVKALDNDRYLVQDIEGEQQSARIYKGILPVDRLKLVPKSE